MSQPRGIRNHNPGNIERTATRWRGMSEDQSGDPRFVVFKQPEYGIRAIGRVLQTYDEVYDLDTVEGILNRWAPPHENDTRSYAQHVADSMGVGIRQPLDMDDAVTVRSLVEAIIRHENGVQPYPSDLISHGLELAGYDVSNPDPNEPAKEPSVQNIISNYLPDRKVLAGGLAGIVAFVVTIGADLMGYELSYAEASGFVGSAVALAAYLIPPSVQDVVKRIDAEVDAWYEDVSGEA